MTGGPRILIVEDEEPIRTGLADRLGREGYRVSTAETVAEAFARLADPFDLVVLDRRLPDGEGLEVLAHLRASGSAMPVIVLSARGEADDRIAGLEGGADDYVTKPFHIRELMARIKAVLARAAEGTPTAPPHIPMGSWQLDVGARLLRNDRATTTLTRMEFALLHYLATRPGQVVTRNELLDRVWGYDRFPTTRTVDYHILALRRKVERDPKDPRHIVTVHGVGYRFDP